MRGGARRPAARRTLRTLSRPAEGANAADGPLSPPGALEVGEAALDVGDLRLAQRLCPEARALVRAGDPRKRRGAPGRALPGTAAELASRLRRTGFQPAPRELAEGPLVEARHARGPGRRRPTPRAPDQPPERARAERARRGQESRAALPSLRPREREPEVLGLALHGRDHHPLVLQAPVDHVAIPA